MSPEGKQGGLEEKLLPLGLAFCIKLWEINTFIKNTVQFQILKLILEMHLVLPLNTVGMQMFSHM